MCGNHRKTIISSKLYWPNGLSIDYPNRRLYFADARLDYIEFCDYDGGNRHKVISMNHVSFCSRQFSDDSSSILNFISNLKSV